MATESPSFSQDKLSRRELFEKVLTHAKNTAYTVGMLATISAASDTIPAVSQLSQGLDKQFVLADKRNGSNVPGKTNEQLISEANTDYRNGLKRLKKSIASWLLTSPAVLSLIHDVAQVKKDEFESRVKSRILNS
ncbi:MAG TPA: hypothetical protein VHE53_01475 [Patescibacteria group bacterium]|nr:hypothetical protein [Patescibacteria group bacterium]